MPFSDKDRKHLSAAQGYLELGMVADSAAELGQIAPKCREQLEFLAIRAGILHETKEWTTLQTVAGKLAVMDPTDPQWPISLAYATRRAQSLDLARVVLLHALKLHPKEALIHFNLACYDCQLGDHSSALSFIEAALRLRPSMRSMALEDPDLEPIRSHLKSSIDSGK